MSTTQNAAKKYIEYGYSPIPLMEGEKRPKLKDWTKYKDSPITDLTLFNTSGLGLVCGYNNLEVLDIDAKHFTGNEFEEFIELLEVNDGNLLSKMVIQSTPSGGFHFLYRCEFIEGNQKLAKNESKEVTFETRGIGGQVAAWPTPGYSLETKASAIQTISKEERELLFSCARAMDKSPKVEITYAPRSTEIDRIPSDELTPWADYNSRNDCLVILQAFGWSIVREDNKFIYVKRPGVSDSKDSGKVFKDSGKLWVWSTSTELEAEVIYNPFSLYVALEHNGDVKRAANTLYEEGYGSRRKQKQNSIAEPVVEEPSEDMLEKYLLDATVEIKNPPSVIELYTGIDSYTLATAGNISLVQGKAKSRKSFFVSSLASCCIRQGYSENLLRSGIVKGNVLFFDTEQGDFHAQRVQQRILNNSGIPFDKGKDYLKYFALRRADTNADRLNIITYALNKFEGISLCVIDGIVDVANGVNEEQEAIALVSKLMKISAAKNIHIVTVLHENKNDRGAKGHLGSYLVQKSESVYGVSRSEDGNTTYIEGLYTRNQSFPDLELMVQGQEVILSVKDVEPAGGKEFSPDELERIARSIVGKTLTQAKTYVRDVERCKLKEASKAISLMEAAKIITFTKEAYPKITLLNSVGNIEEDVPF